MRTVSRTLQAALQNQRSEKDVDGILLEMLGDITGPRRWLAASLDKTIRLQMGL
jgi:hypothetical protein